MTEDIRHASERNRIDKKADGKAQKTKKEVPSNTTVLVGNKEVCKKVVEETRLENIGDTHVPYI